MNKVAKFLGKLILHTADFVLYDLKLFVDEWLCSCPYDWPLR